MDPKERRHLAEPREMQTGLYGPIWCAPYLIWARVKDSFFFLAAAGRGMARNLLRKAAVSFPQQRMLCEIVSWRPLNRDFK